MASTEPHEPSPLPDPPADFASRRLPMRRVRGPWVRLHACRQAARFFGRTGENRFDASSGESGVLYAAADEFCAFAEVFGDPLDRRVVSLADLVRLCWSRIASGRPLRLVDLTGPGLRQISADVRLVVGEHAHAQRWAHAVWQHPNQPDGIIYRPRHDPSRVAVVIFNRAEDAVGATRIGRVTNNLALLGRVLDHYGFALVD